MSSPQVLRLSKLSFATSLILSGYALADEANVKSEPLEKIAVYGQHHKNYITEEAQSATKLGLTIKETPQSIEEGSFSQSISINKSRSLFNLSNNSLVTLLKLASSFSIGLL